MEVAREREDHRAFRPATVGACHAQTATERFGDEAKRAIGDRERVSLGIGPAGMEWPLDWPGSDAEDDENPHSGSSISIYKLVPAMQAYRNNLTALSQKYNLYFAAYRGRVFVYVPRSVPKQTLPTHPDIQLTTSPSRVAYLIGGYLDQASPHSINHILVGSLGQEEILLACYDDGDVIAHYTKDIAEYIVNKSNSLNSVPSSPRSASLSETWNAPKPFFHENVGMSAWGLAIHQKSRLIAVSSNRFEITVFAPALAVDNKKSATGSKNCDCSVCCHNVETHVRRRARNWRIIVSLGPLADNIPNICFVDDEDGHAEKVSAIDIKGAMWLADIWRPGQAAIRVMPSTSSLLKSEEFWPASSRGWGIFALEHNDFLTVQTEEELLGAPLKDLEIMPKLHAGPHPMVNVAKYLRDLPDNPCSPPPGRVYMPRPNNQPMEIPDLGDGHPVAGELMAIDHATDESESEFGITENSEEGDDDDDDDDDEMETNSDEDSEAEGELSDSGDDGDDLGATLGLPGAPALSVGSDIPPALLEFGSSNPQLTGTGSSPGSVLKSLGMSLEESYTPATGSPAPSAGQSVPASYNNSPRSSVVCPRLRQRSPPALLDMVYLPHRGQVSEAPRHTIPLARFLKRATECNENSAGYVAGLDRFAERYHMLRLYEKDLEMRTLDKHDQKGLTEFGILCPYALTMGLSPGRAMRPHFRATSRLSMVIHIPELWLLVIGSPIGRVVLVTPTRLATPTEKWPGVLHHGLRIEWVLPRQSDENLFRATKRPLHGMAVGPVQEDGVIGTGASEMKRAAGPRRFRLMLHYRNHDILSYEISREEQTGKICIF